MKSSKYIMEGHKLYWHLDRVRDWMKGKRIVPIHIDVGLSKGCNIRCEYCFGVLQGNFFRKGSEVYFPRETLRMIVQQPLEAAKLTDRFGIKVEVEGGGLSGQAGAVRLGIARALLEFDQNLRQLLRKNGFLTRDPRKKERKKYGRKGARRSFQYTKR